MQKILVAAFVFVFITMTWALALPNGDDVAVSSVEKYDDGGIASVILSDQENISIKWVGRVPVKGEVTFSTNGELTSCTITESVKVNNPYGGKFWIQDLYRAYYNSRFMSASLAKPTRVRTTIGTLKVQNYLEYWIRGTVKECELFKPKRIRTAVGRIKIKDKVYFHLNTELSNCMLAEPQEISTRSGSFVVTDSISFGMNGFIQACSLAEPQEVKTRVGTVMAEGDLVFDTAGHIMTCTLAAAQVIDTPSGPISVNGEMGRYPFNAETHEYGGLFYCTLANDTEIEGKQYTAGTVIYWDEEGSFLGDK